MAAKSKNPVYNVWKGMHYRCANPNFRQWARYGGRGIKVCAEWADFDRFVLDMGPRPSPRHSLDRIDNDGDYTPDNCRWATRKEQQRNQAVTRWIAIDGQQFRAADLADVAGRKTDTIIQRAKSGLPYDEVVTAEHRRDLSGLALGGVANGERQRAKTHCPKGHSYDDAIITKKGWRRCRRCFYDREKQRLAKKRAKVTDSKMGREL